MEVHSVFASLYLRDLQYEFESWKSLGPLVAAGTVVHSSLPGCLVFFLFVCGHCLAYNNCLGFSRITDSLRCIYS